ncbi:MAG: ATP-dependent helicase [Candidatus Binatia bacterium]
MTALNPTRPMKPDFPLGNVNAEQRAAVLAIKGPSLVIAGPGSGKTQTLTAKALYILKRHPGASILCMTHTRKAAEEMRSRIAKHEGSESINVFTIHSLCYAILQKTHRRPIKILSNYDHGVIIRLAARAVGFEADPREISRLISQTKLGLIDIREDRTKLVDEYERLKGLRLDYDDLLLSARESLGSCDESVVSPSHILVDEAQDLDRIQIELIQRLCGTNPNVTFFLDYNQAIFSFKGACYDEIQQLAEIYPDTRKFYLARNHRSTGKILDSANRLIRGNGSENCSIPTREAGITPLWVPVTNETTEARLATEIAADLIQEGFEPREILILYRTNHYRAEIESELIDNEVPYSILKNTSLFLKEGPFLPLCLQAWRLDDTWEEILLRHYLGRRYAVELCTLAKELKQTPFDTAHEQAINDPDTQRGMNLLFEDLQAIQHHRNEKPLAVAKIASAIIEKRGFIIDTRETKGLLRFMARYRNLGEIIVQIEKLRHLSSLPREKRIHLSTIHRAKGLEHRAVILLGCVEGVLPLEIRDEANIPEERRLAYVALTRAKDLFIAISPKNLYGEPTEPSRFIREMALRECDWVKSAR